MGSQGTAKGVKAENVGQVEKPYQVVAEIYEGSNQGKTFPMWC